MNRMARVVMVMNTTHSTRLDKGPARAMRAAETFIWNLRVSRAGLNSTGLAQPMKKPPNNRPSRGNTTVPMGSMWAKGFKVMRPIRAAVSSSSR